MAPKAIAASTFAALLLAAGCHSRLVSTEEEHSAQPWCALALVQYTSAFTSRQPCAHTLVALALQDLNRSTECLMKPRNDEDSICVCSPRASPRPAGKHSQARMLAPYGRHSVEDVSTVVRHITAIIFAFLWLAGCHLCPNLTHGWASSCHRRTGVAPLHLLLHPTSSIPSLFKAMTLILQR